MLKTRTNALKLALWDPALLWYAKAVAAMKSRPANDPTGWIYQAAIHGWTDDPALKSSTATWKQWTHNQVLPTAQQRTAFWGQCQHGTWYFLPWHRIYLGYFEKIVGKTIVDLGGPADWALPYWNYDQGVPSGKLPDAFTQAKLPDGSVNALLEPKRDAGNDGKPFLVQKRIALAPAFGEHQFASSTPTSSPGFGGPVTRFEHSGGTHGALETAPHDEVHVEIGGWMGNPATAAVDPIFWLHHANIDRLWAAWLKADPANKNPLATSKWQAFRFTFNDGLGKTPTLTPADIVDSKSSVFSYEYDDLSTAVPVKPAAVPSAPPSPMTEEPLPEMIGASSAPLPLTSEAKTTSVPLFPVSGPLLALGAVGTPFNQAYLHVENVRGKGQPGSFDVYLNVPDGAGEEDAERFYIGTVPTFGLEHASVSSSRHPGNGLRFTFNVTDAVNLLKTENKWDPAILKVTFRPTKALPADAEVQVGRVSLYFA
jgi:tyrosinase